MKKPLKIIAYEVYIEEIEGSSWNQYKSGFIMAENQKEAKILLEKEFKEYIDDSNMSIDIKFNGSGVIKKGYMIELN